MLFLLLLTTLGQVPTALSHAVLFEQTPMVGTTYYDLTNQYCNDVWGNAWADYDVNHGVPSCNGQHNIGLDKMGSNQIVAMNANLLYSNLTKWCGKEVQVFLPSGEQYQLAEGPFILWDGCYNCTIEAKIDFPAKAFVEMKGGSCWGRNIEGLHVKVLDNNIWHYRTDGTGGRADDFVGVKGTAVGTGPPVTGPGGVPFPSKTASPAGVASGVAGGVALGVPQVSGEPGKGRCPLGQTVCQAGYKYTCTEINPGNMAWIPSVNC